MSTGMSEDEIRQIALKRVEAKKGFYIHLTVYIIVNAFLFIIWFFVAGRGYPWFLWPLGGWGLGLLFHAMGTFAFPTGGADWERREIEKEMQKLRKDQGK